MKLNLLLGALIFVTFATGYVVFARPWLKSVPSLKYLWDQEESFFRAFRLKFAGLKQKILTSLLMAAGLIVSCYDAIAPFIVDAGVDPGLLLPKVPAFVWPIASMAILALIQHFRNIADRNAAANAAVLVELDIPLAAPAPAVPLVPVEVPSSEAAKV